MRVLSNSKSSSHSDCGQWPRRSDRYQRPHLWTVLYHQTCWRWYRARTFC